MGELVLLILAAAWAAVLLPPLMRSRFENRPNSSVTDFHRQLSRLQGTVPPRAAGSMRTVGRPLASSHRVGAQQSQAGQRQRRVHGLDDDQGLSAMSPGEVMRRRRTNVLFGLVLTTASLLFLAATTKEAAMLYLFSFSFLALCGYLYLLVTIRQRSSSPWSARAGDDWLRR
ncbi:MAG: hypothetical protein ACO39Q_11075 [Ilumatobacteraceae bacterium]